MGNFLFIFGLGFFGLVLGAVFFVKRRLELLNRFEVIDNLLMWDSIELKIIVLIFNTCLINVNINDLTETNLIKIHRNMFMFPFSILMLWFFYAFDKFRNNFITFLEWMWSQAGDHFFNKDRCCAVLGLYLELVNLLVDFLDNHSNCVVVHKFVVAFFGFWKDLWRSVMANVVPSVRYHFELFFVNSWLVAVVASGRALVNRVVNDYPLLVVAFEPTRKGDQF